MIDVGANLGQYARACARPAGAGRCCRSSRSPSVRAVLAERAAADPAWRWHLAMARGERAASPARGVGRERHELDLRQSALLRGISPTSAVLRRIVVPQRRLDEVDALRQRPWRRLFVKIDVQGAEPAVLAGMEGSGSACRACSWKWRSFRSTRASGRGST